MPGIQSLSTGPLVNDTNKSREGHYGKAIRMMSPCYVKAEKEDQGVGQWPFFWVNALVNYAYNTQKEARVVMSFICTDYYNSGILGSGIPAMNFQFNVF
jgi:hypothetical protein